ncbi:hypothetical protein, partial [Vibrio alfacsensis]|uniref:hypothetical protein n=1 Tax=Vibrio TaxID=662 RepID=UPI0040690B30
TGRATVRNVWFHGRKRSEHSKRAASVSLSRYKKNRVFMLGFFMSQIEKTIQLMRSNLQSGTICDTKF